MGIKLFAVALQEDGSIAPHAGRALHWAVYTANKGSIQHMWDVLLSEPGTLHEWHRTRPYSQHPLHTIDIAIAASAGEGVVINLAKRNVQLFTSHQNTAEAAIQDFINGADMAPEDHKICIMGRYA